jgi:hypothetical protein
MPEHCPVGRVNRRQFLCASAAAVPLISAAGPSAAAQVVQATRSVTHQGGDVTALSKLAAPGLYPGRVVEVRNPGMCRNGNRDAAAIKTTLDRCMKELTGAQDAVLPEAILRAGRRGRHQGRPQRSAQAHSSSRSSWGSLKI